MSVRRLTVVMDVDTGRATASLGAAGRAVRQFGLDTKRSSDNISHMGRTFDSFGTGMQRPLQTLRDYVLVLGNLRFALMNVRDLAVGWVWGLMKQAGELERLTILMRGFSKATTEAGKTQEATANLHHLMNQARATGFEVKTLADAFIKFQSADLNPTTYSLRGLTEAVAKFGGNSDVMHRASIAIQQMAGKGKISMEELRQQLGEAVPSAMKIMANALGVTVAKLGDEIKKGHVKAKPALELMLRDMETQFGGAGKALANTFFGQLAQVKTNMMQLSADFAAMGNEEGLFATAKQSLKELNEMMMSGEGRQAMRQLGQIIADIAQVLAGTVKFIVEWRNEIGTLVVTLAKLWAISKGAQVIGWIAGMGMSAAQAFRGMGDAAVQNQGQLAGWTRSSDQLVSSIDRQRAASEAWVQRTQQSFVTANHAVANTRNQITNLEGLNRTYGQNIEILQRQQRQERSNLQTAQTLQAANLASGRSGAQSAIMVDAAQTRLNTTTRSLISQQRLQRATTAELAAAQAALTIQENAVTAATHRMTLAERANAISKGFVATAARACQGSIALMVAAVNLETGAVARATIAERLSAVSKGLYASAARAAGVAAGFMGRMASLALGPIGAIGLAAYTAAQYFGLFTNKANEAAAAAANLAGQMANLNDIKTAQSRVDEIDEKLGQNGKGSFWFSNVIWAPGQKDKLLKERADLVAKMKKGAPNAYANEGRDAVGLLDYRLNNSMDTLRARARLMAENEKLEERIAKGDKAAIARSNQLRDNLARIERGKVEGQLNAAQRMLAASKGNPNAEAKYSAVVVGLSQKLDGLKQVGSSAALQMEAFGGEGKGAGGGAAAKTLANNVGGLTGEIAALDAKLRGDVSTNLVKFEATLKAGGFQGKSPQELELMRRKAALQDAIADSNRSQKGENSYESVLASMTGRLAELNDELIGGEGNLSKFNAQLDAGKFSELSDVQIEKLRATAEALDEAEKNLRLKDLNKDLAKATAEADAMWGSFNTGAQTAAKRLAGLRAGFEDKLIGLSGEQLKEAEAVIDRIVSKLNSAEAAKFMQSLADDSASARQDLMPEEQARVAAFERERQQRKIQLDSFLMDETLHIDRKQELQRNYNSWVLNERRRVDRANETQMQKQLRDWANLGQAIQATMTQAMSSFVDSLAEGKFAFKDFAKDLLKQLLKIIIQAMIAYAIMSALGMGTGAGGAKQSFGDFMKGQIGAGFGVTPAETNHHGGYVGDGMGLTKMVSSAMFASASKYHTGGGISQLGPKEVPLIGLEGERVLNEEQQRQLGKDMAENGGKATPVTINFINNSGQDLQAEQSEPHFDGKEMVVGIVIEALSKQGRVRDAVAAIGRESL